MARLNQEVQKYLSSPEAKSAFLKGGIETAATTPEELVAITKSEISTIGKVLKAAGLHRQPK